MHTQTGGFGYYILPATPLFRTFVDPDGKFTKILFFGTTYIVVSALPTNNAMFTGWKTPLESA